MKPRRSPANRPAKISGRALRVLGESAVASAEAVVSGASAEGPRPSSEMAVEASVDAASSSIELQSRRRTTSVPFTAWPIPREIRRDSILGRMKYRVPACWEANPGSEAGHAESESGEHGGRARGRPGEPP